MNIIFLRWSAIILVIGLFTVLSSGCVVSGGGYGYDDGMGIGGDYYEPSYGATYGAAYGGAYGGWEPGYRVGPLRDGGHRSSRDGVHPPPHAYRPAPISHSMPSIPTRSRSGGSRSH